MQVAKARGATVIATARAEQAEWLTELGADQVIDYRERALRGAGRRPRRGDRLHRRLRRALAAGAAAGRHAGLGAERRRRRSCSTAAKERRRRVTGFLVEPDPVGLAGLASLIEAGQLQVHVDTVFELERAADAHRPAEEHHGGGKIVLRVPAA